MIRDPLYSINKRNVITPTRPIESKETMFGRKKPRSGEFEFAVKQNSQTLFGNLKWTEKCTDAKQGGIQASIVIDDKEINRHGYGHQIKYPIEQIHINMSSREIAKLKYSGSTQQNILENSVKIARNKNTDFSREYSSEVCFISLLHESKIESVFFAFLKLKIVKPISDEVMGRNKSKASHVGHPQLDPREKRISKRLFRAITILSGVVTIWICIASVDIDPYKISIAIFASLTAWAAREAKIADDITHDDHKYTYRDHLVGSSWKLAGYISTAMVSVVVISAIHAGLTDQVMRQGVHGTANEVNQATTVTPIHNIMPKWIGADSRPTEILPSPQYTHGVFDSAQHIIFSDSSSLEKRNFKNTHIDSGFLWSFWSGPNSYFNIRMRPYRLPIYGYRTVIPAQR